MKHLSPWAIITFTLLLILYGCANTRQSGPFSHDRLSARQAEDAILVKNLTDSVLLALSLRDYSTLREFLPPDDNRSGRYVAEIFLGDAVSTAVMEKWDAQYTTIRFSDDGQTAWTAIPVSYRRHPSGPLETTTFRFKFQRCATKNQWYLLLP